VSMGGSSFLFTCASIGIILSVARNIERSEDVNNPEPKVAVVEVDDAKNQTKKKEA
jgi:cell division protein FtsW